MYKVLVCSFLLMLFSCNNSTSQVEQETDQTKEFNYVSFFNEYKGAVEQKMDFSEIVDSFFYDPEGLKKDTSSIFSSSPSSYAFQDVANASYEYELGLDSNEFNYYWNKEIENTPYGFYDTLCDCNLVIESTVPNTVTILDSTFVDSGVFYLTVCFYKEKIYSLNTTGFTR